MHGHRDSRALRRWAGCGEALAAHTDAAVNAARTTGYDLYRELYEQGLSDRQMADKLGVPARRVSRWRWNKALPPNIPKEVQP